MLPAARSATRSMIRMRRPLALAFLLTVGLPACGGQPVSGRSNAGATATASGSTPVTAAAPTAVSPTGAPSPPPSPETDVALPRRAPSTYGPDVGADELRAASLAPRRSQVASVEAVADTFSFVWARAAAAFSTPETGFEVWARSPGADPAWRVVYAFTDPAGSGVFGVRVERGDLTGDGVADALTFEDTGGSGACGTWRVIGVESGDASELFSKQTCDTDVRIVTGDLRMRASVYAPGDAHCCPSAYRTSTLRWNGQGWEVVRRATTAA
jgi:hypothetical protein